MVRTMQTWVAGFVSLIAVSACGPLHAQSTYDPLLFCGAVGESGALKTETGLDYSFPSGGRPLIESFNAAVATANFAAATTPAVELDGTASVASVLTLVAPTEPTSHSATLNYLDGQTAGTGEMYIIIFSTAEFRDAFLYYLAQRDQSTTYADYLSNDALVSYSFWLGQENESIALYTYFTTLGDYFYVTTVEESPGLAGYYYWYYRGVGAYYYYERQGDLASAEAAYAYHLAVADTFL